MPPNNNNGNNVRRSSIISHSSSTTTASSNSNRNHFDMVFDDDDDDDDDNDNDNINNGNNNIAIEPKPNDVCFKSLKHEGTKIFRETVRLVSSNTRDFPVWYDEIVDLIKEHLRSEHNITRFLVSLDANGNPSKKISKGKWYLANEAQILFRTKERFREDRKKRSTPNSIIRNTNVTTGARPLKPPSTYTPVLDATVTQFEIKLAELKDLAPELETELILNPDGIIPRLHGIQLMLASLYGIVSDHIEQEHWTDDIDEESLDSFTVDDADTAEEMEYTTALFDESIYQEGLHLPTDEASAVRPRYNYFNELSLPAVIPTRMDCQLETIRSAAHCMPMNSAVAPDTPTSSRHIISAAAAAGAANEEHDKTPTKDETSCRPSNGHNDQKETSAEHNNMSPIISDKNIKKETSAERNKTPSMDETNRRPSSDKNVQKEVSAEHNMSPIKDEMSRRPFSDKNIQKEISEEPNKTPGKAEMSRRPSSDKNVQKEVSKAKQFSTIHSNKEPLDGGEHTESRENPSPKVSVSIGAETNKPTSSAPAITGREAGSTAEAMLRELTAEMATSGKKCNCKCVSKKMDMPIWKNEFFATLTPDEFGCIIANVNSDSHRPRLAEFVAKQVNGFSSEHVSKAIEQTEACAFMAKLLQPLCVDTVNSSKNAAVKVPDKPTGDRDVDQLGSLLSSALHLSEKSS